MDKLPLSIGILSWGAHSTLINTLESYRQNGLLDKAAHPFIFFQEKSEEDERIAKEYGFAAYGQPTNIGIAGAYKQMLDLAQYNTFLFLENDWKYADNVSNPYQIEEGMAILAYRAADVIRYRNRKEPGNPLWTKQFQNNELSRPEHLFDSLHWVEDPSSKFPGYISQIYAKDFGQWFRTVSAYANWTNNPHMIQTSWARLHLAPRLGDRDIELDMQQWWQQQNIVVAQSEGLFTHWRL